MTRKTNYSLALERELESIAGSGETPRLLLHACCAPCSSYCLEYLTARFDIDVFYYNPNISPESEYLYRVGELKRLIEAQPHANEVRLVEGRYDPERFLAVSKGHETEPEGGERCFKCYALRLEETAAAAQRGGYDYFTTTLSISPYKNAVKLNEIGARMSEKYGVKYLYSDFKKKGGYQRSIALSKEYNLYRQDYCGCVFSRREADERRKRNESHDV